MRIGVVAFQGAFREHISKLERLGTDVIAVKVRKDLDGLNGIVIPGGESTVIGRFLHQKGLSTVIAQRVLEGSLALMGTCAGAILACKKISNNPPMGSIGVFPAEAKRNHYGTQRDSFQGDVTFYDGHRVPGVFIRAPKLVPLEGASVLGLHNGEPAALSWGRCLLVSFHPELTDDDSVHSLFLKMSSTG
ncbi:pyridoxal 5''-phosphate synthase, glutaminase subunit Pdx2 [Thermanaerovibrio velox DSM 12556]|uniref:glutaminase n=1 Tax=Thermanaerovibrio velox DSM 12556 TaxID=926567 RepID=H0UN76_9BACT|nr:pyridoxal 5'-phosphate synthase glutaminase subunit PdxT [Thermanaerovibrio velox]EHM10361.1 pyridoxal 5''-phosphate synthase, glutaminase subunit Pdx2 [Thermanaerovibrio velox DSM 12556]